MGCSRFGLGLGFPKSTKEPTGRAGCLGGMAWFDFDENQIEDGEDGDDDDDDDD